MDRTLLEKPFSPDEIKQRDGSFGTTLDYLETHSVIRRLNEAFEGEWSFEVTHHDINPEADEVIVLGKLTAGEVAKTQFGSAKIKKARGSGEPLSLGDDLKAAASDALKKCATLLGVGLHLYGDVPNPEQAGQVKTESPTKPVTRSRPGMGPGVLGMSRLSPKQHSYIMNLLKDSGVTKQELNAHCQEAYGVVVDHLSRQDASNLIETLMHDGIQPSGNGNGNGRDHHQAA